MNSISFLYLSSLVSSLQPPVASPPAQSTRSVRKWLSRQPHAAAAGGRRQSAADFLTLYIRILLDTIGTCMQNFMKIDRQKNQAFFNYSLRTLFSGHTVHRRGRSSFVDD